LSFFLSVQEFLRRKKRNFYMPKFCSSIKRKRKGRGLSLK
jgi:hypothetical protein